MSPCGSGAERRHYFLFFFLQKLNTDDNHDSSVPVTIAEETLVEKSAKEAKKSVADVQQIGGWLGLLLSKIKSVPAAEEKWRALTAAGLDQEAQEEVAEYLFRYCGGTQEQLQAGFKKASSFRERLQTVVAQIRMASGTTERMLKDMRDIAGITFHNPDFDRLSSTLREFADELESLEPVLKNTVARGVREEKDGRITGGRSESLSILVDLVSRVTDDPYAHLAPLVAAIKGDVDPSYEYIADGLRSAYNRYRWNTGVVTKNPAVKSASRKPGR